MMRKIVFLLLFLGYGYLYAQKADLKKCLKYTEKSLAPYCQSGSVYPSWIDGGDYFWYTWQTTEGINYYLVDVRTGKKIKMFEVGKMACELTQLTGTNYDVKDFRLGALEFEKDNPYRFSFSRDGIYFKYNIKTKHLEKIDKEVVCRRFDEIHPYWMQFSPDSNYMMYAYKHNLYLRLKGDTTAFALTIDGACSYSYASSRDKDTDKKERAAGTWSGDSKVYYVLRQDRRQVKEGWLIDHLAKPRPTLKTYKFPMPGEPGVYTYDLHIFHPENREHIVVDLAKYPDQEVKMMRFDFKKQSRYLYLTRKSRTCDQQDLCRVDTRTGEVFEILSETSKPHFTEQLFECHILNQGDDIIWWSENDGWGHFYLYDWVGKLKSRITSGDFVACKILQIDTLNRNLIFEGYGKEKGIDPECRLYYRVNFDGTGFTLLTPGDGYHSISVSSNGNYFVDNYSRADMEPVAELRGMKGGKIADLERADLQSLYATGWRMPKRVQVKAADGRTDLYGVMYSPFDMDTTRKYPVIINVYPGPQEDYVPKTFALDDNGNQSLAQLGFIVLNVGFRGGCLTRGKTFHTFGYGNLRDYALADSKFVIEQLANKYTYIDLDRVGIYGHSGGGFMAAAAILTYPDFFKVAVAASGNHDNNIYTQWWGETYQGVKLEEQEGKSSYHFTFHVPTNIELASNLKGKLCLITGDMDLNVHMAHTIRLANALIKANKRFDLVILPGADHGLASDYYMNLIRYYFIENLLGQRINGVDMVRSE